jgi:hypothetical protein
MVTPVGATGSKVRFTPDGQHFVVVSPPGADAQGMSAINVISDWQAGLKK